MTAAKKYLPHYTVSDYQQWEGDWELWQGIAVSMSPGPFGRHQAAAKRLLILLDNELRRSNCQAEVIHEMDWIVSDDTVVRPDVVVLCDGVPDRYIETTPAVVAEVLSDSTRGRDTTYKRDLYDELGVEVYVLIDPDVQTLEIYRRDTSGNWQGESVTDSVMFSVCSGCELRLTRTALFAP
ncbi:Uma2 family endonuclease [Roseimaritima ulvae]|uniref:Putative restriction endonuclease domain-containing protein n=1 Tax=Roseimaritima ulvae TaxID=980254 RepID=A0A5B9QUI9_9BACT|nr:Uma2 family endonuclease [Roseimaritima ulvae]QEG42674.1 hypothetical protein UC8_47160 [Roseimaritima ulvae]